MSAFRRRTTFAAPLIVTVATSCSEKTATQEPQLPTWQVTMRDMKCRAQQGGNPPPPVQAIECPPGMTGNVTMTVVQRRDGTCVTQPAKHVTPCPLPPGKQLARALSIVWTIEKRGADCHAEEDDACPPGVDCNPPMPRTFPCPPGVTEDKPLRVAELPDATCVIVPDGCVDTSCAKEPTVCPPEDAR